MDLFEVVEDLLSRDETPLDHRLDICEILRVGVFELPNGLSAELEVLHRQTTSIHNEGAT